MSKVLVVSLCNEKMHDLEFVLPVVDVLKKGDIEFEMKYYKDIINAEKYSHVIIAGTSLQDDSFIDNIDYFSWLKSYNGKVLGICAGMQVLGLMFGGIINEGEEIGYYFEEFNLDFFGLNGKQEVYHLHNNCIYNWEDIGFDILCLGKNGIGQAVKYREKEFYGVLFHPEVRNKNMIEKFVK